MPISRAIKPNMKWIFFLSFFIGMWFVWQGFVVASPPIRGVWIDTKSIPTTRESITAIIERLQEAHFNAIFLESFYNGKTVYPSQFLASLGLSPQMDIFARSEIDPLQIFLEEAHKRGMEIHAWMHIFYISRNEPGELLTHFPHWAVVSKDGKPGYQSGTNFLYWLCPLEEEVQNFYHKLLEELADRYPLDGIQFDYYRFPEPTLADTCYAEKHRRALLKQYGVDPITIDPLKDGDLSQAWIQFRADGLTEFTRTLTTNLKKNHPQIRLSCAVKPLGFPIKRYPGSLQDWPRWAEENLFDFLVPMTYSSRPAEFEGMLLWIRTFAPHTPLLAGIWTMNLNTSTILEEIERAKQYPLSGLVFFAYPYLTDEIMKALSQREPYEHEARTIPSVSFYRENARTIKASFTQEPIAVDGKLDEPTWQKILFQNQFTLLSGGPSEKKTEVAVQYDETKLYFAIRMEDFPERPLRFGTRDEPVFYEDSAEIYLDPFGNEGIFYQLAINGNGGIYDSFSLTGPSWNGNWEIGVERTGSTLTMEVAIPFAELKVQKPEPGSTWGINFYRNEPQDGLFSAFSPVPGVYPAVTLLGKLRFEK
ncbi:MAG: family 10 glycosylhydrolase [Candidatus Atribacteria bacterium]|nr:family 10 glycosylhydrolase [Candidatus Atribacteria bacterium]